MSEKSLTLLELHLDDSHIQLGPRTISTGRSRSSDAENGIDVIDGEEGSTADGAAEDGSETGRVGSAAKGLLALLLVGSLALAAWKLLAEGDLEAVEELDELAE